MATNTATEMTEAEITERALISRLRRRHARDGGRFCVTRASWSYDLGRWHSVDDRNVINGKWDTLPELVEHARDIGVLAHDGVVGS